MSFDKAKAMRSAERFVAQGKLKNAIAEYRAVVDNDPRDIATMNMLGDLYAKNAEKREAVNCYLRVADHYNAQGFAQKAIAIYNKICRIQPDSIEVSAKLAELHRSKGSLSEARSHYMTLADHYKKKGRTLEALAMFKQIALLDPNNTEVCLSLAESYLREGQSDEAVEAYAEAGSRFARLGMHEESIEALMKGYTIHPSDLRVLEGLVREHGALGRAAKGVSLLEEILENEPFNREVLYLLIDCCIESQNAAQAEAAVIRLVEIEPANYPKFLELIRIYLNESDTNSAARILNMSSEYLLAAGQSDEFGKWISEILEREPNHLTALRLLVRYNSYLNDDSGTRLALERLNAAATVAESVDDERYALTHLSSMRPQETRYKDRLAEINDIYGFEEPEGLAEASPVQVEEEDVESHVNVGSPELETFHSNGQVHDSVLEAEIVDRFADTTAPNEEPTAFHSVDVRIQKEIESIKFYLENEYIDLAVKALAELVQEFGERPEFAEIRSMINGEPFVQVTPQAPSVAIPQEANGSSIGLDEIRSEFGLDDGDAAGGDYDTHYHTAVAYQEMGLMEQAIAEFQDAIACTRPDDGSRRFFYCANLLGHCFMENGSAKHAITWFARALETPGITDEEQHGIWYELGLAHEANNDQETAAKLFEQIYAENVDFRDVAKRVKDLVAAP
jgi:tetratricopeptide (TPR) repeat protein